MLRRRVSNPFRKVAIHARTPTSITIVAQSPQSNTPERHPIPTTDPHPSKKRILVYLVFRDLARQTLPTHVLRDVLEHQGRHILLIVLDLGAGFLISKFVVRGFDALLRDPWFSGYPSSFQWLEIWLETSAGFICLQCIVLTDVLLERRVQARRCGRP